MASPASATAYLVFMAGDTELVLERFLERFLEIWAYPAGARQGGCPPARDYTCAIVPALRTRLPAQGAGIDLSSERNHEIDRTIYTWFPCRLSDQGSLPCYERPHRGAAGDRLFLCDSRRSRRGRGSGGRCFCCLQSKHRPRGRG